MEKILIEKLKKSKGNKTTAATTLRERIKEKQGKALKENKIKEKIGTREIIKYVNNSHIKIINLDHRAIEILGHY